MTGDVSGKGWTLRQVEGAELDHWDADAVDAPGALAHALDLGTERAHRVGGIDHVLAFEQPGYVGLAHRKRTDDERAMRDRLVAGYARAAFQGARAARSERR